MERGSDLRLGTKTTRDTNRDANRRLVLQSVFSLEPVSRAGVARETSLGKPYVSELVSELVADGPVIELGVGATDVGRPPTMLGIDVERFSTVALDISVHPFRGCVTDLRGRFLPGTERSVARQSGLGAVDGVRQLCMELLEASPIQPIGIGIGAPGVVDNEGNVLRAANLGWEGVALAEDLARDLGVPVHVANDADAAAMAEFGRRKASPGGNMVFVLIGEGLGAGIVLGGRLHHGDGFAAGELGHVTVDAAGFECQCGRVGCLETVASVEGLRRAYEATIAHDEDAPSFALDRLRETVVGISVLRRGGATLGRALGNLVSVLDVRSIVLGGEVVDAGPVFIDSVRQAAVDHVVYSGRAAPEIHYSDAGGDAVLMGAAALVVNRELGVIWGTS